MRRSFAVEEFGPVDGVFDLDTINACLAYVREHFPSDGALVRFNSTAYRTTGPINATGLTKTTLSGLPSAAIYADGFSSTFLPILDITASPGIRLEGLALLSYQYGTRFTAPSVLPGCGVLNLDSADGAANSQDFYRLSVIGHFSDAAFYAHGMTQTSFDHCTFHQYTSGVPVMRISDTDPVGYLSPFANEFSAATSRPCGDIAFRDCEWHKMEATGVASCLALHDVYHLSIENGVIDCNVNGSSFVHLTGSNNYAHSYKQVSFYRENGSAAFPTYVFNLTTANANLYGVTLDECHFQQSGGLPSSLFNLSSTSALHNVHLLGSLSVNGLTAGAVVAGGGASATLDGGLIDCKGLPVNLGTGAISASTVLVNPGTVTTAAGSDLSRKIGGSRTPYNIPLGSPTVGVSAGTTAYYGANGGEAAENNALFIAPVAMTLKGLRVFVEGSPGAGQSFVCTVRVNGSDTSITCTVSGANTSASDLVNTASVAAGGRVSLRVAGSAGAGTTGSVSATLQAHDQ